MKYKLEFLCEDWLGEKTLRTVLYQIILSRQTKELVRNLYIRYIPDSRNMGSAACYVQSPDFGEGMMDPDALGMTVCISQAYSKDGRYWKKLAEELLDLYEELLHDAYRLGLIPQNRDVELFVEGNTSNTEGRSEFVEAGPKMITGILAQRKVTAPVDDERGAKHQIQQHSHSRFQ